MKFRWKKMFDHITLNHQVEEILIKSKKSLVDIRTTLLNSQNENTLFKLESKHSINSDQLISQGPPIWDNDLLRIYIKNLVESFISQPREQFLYTTRTERYDKTNNNIKTRQKDECVMVNELDFVNLENEKYQETDIDLKAEWKPIKKVISNTVMKNKNVITPRTTRTAKLRAELNRQDEKEVKTLHKKHPQVKKVQSPKKPPPFRSKANTSPFHRFLGGRNWCEQKFFEDNPNFSIVYDNSNSLFPKRIFKSVNNENKQLLIEEKENVKKEKYLEDMNNKNPKLSLHYMQDKKLPTTEKCKKHIDSRKHHIDSAKSSTWHEVLLEKNLKENIYKYLGEQYQMDIEKVKQNETILREIQEKQDWQLNEEKKSKENEEKLNKKSSKQFNTKELIDFGSNILEVKKQLPKNLKKLSTKNLPVLFIKSECQIQKLSPVDIQPCDENEKYLNKINGCGIKNTKFEEFLHGAEEVIENINENKTIMMESKLTNIEKKPLNKPICANVEVGKEKTIKINKYLQPFINSEIKSDIIQEDDYNSDSFETVSSSSTIKQESLTSLQTDDQKLKSKSTTTSQVKESFLEKCEKKSRNSTNGNSDDVLNMLEEIFAAAVKKINELPELKILDSESESVKLDKIITDNKKFDLRNQKSANSAGVNIQDPVPTFCNVVENAKISEQGKILNKMSESQKENLILKYRSRTSDCNEIKSRDLLNENIKNQKYNGRILKEMSSGEQESVKILRKKTPYQIDDKREMLKFDNLKTQQEDTNNKNYILSKDLKGNVQPSSEELNKTEKNEKMSTIKKYTIVPGVCNTKQVNISTLNKSNIKRAKKDSFHEINDLSLSSSSSNILKKFITSNSYESNDNSLKENSLFSPLFSIESSDSCCTICNARPIQYCKLNHHCNSLKPEFLYNSASISDTLKNSYDIRKNKNTNVLDRINKIQNSRSKIKSNTNKTYNTSEATNRKNLSSYISLSVQNSLKEKLNLKENLKQNKNTNRFLKSKTNRNENSFHFKIKKNIEKPYDPEVKKAVHKFLNSLDISNQTTKSCQQLLIRPKNYEQKHKIKQKLKDVENCNLTLSNFLLISTNLSDDLSSNTSEILKSCENNKTAIKSEKLEAQIPLQRSLTFTLDKNESILESVGESFYKENNGNLKLCEKIADINEVISTEMTIETTVRNQLQSIKDNISDLSTEINKTNNKLKSTYKNLLESTNLSSSDLLIDDSEQNLEIQTSTSFSDISLSISYNKLNKIFSHDNNLKKKSNLNAENFSDGEVPSLGEI